MNTSSKLNLRFAVLLAIILLAAFSRIIPHMPNLSPLGVIGLFGAAYFQKKWQAFLVPIAATWLSDLFINRIKRFGRDDLNHQDYPSKVYGLKETKPSFPFLLLKKCKMESTFIDEPSRP